MKEFKFGDYLITHDHENHIVIADKKLTNALINPTWYELFFIKCMAFGIHTTAVEIFPDINNLVDGQNQRHLFKIDANLIPNLKDGHLIK